MKFLGDWKWNSALAIFAIFTVLVVCWPRPRTRHLDNPVAPTAAEPDVAPANMPPARPARTPDELEDMLHYTVQDDDTVAKIAHLFVITEEEIRWANHIPEDRDFTPGDKILIPSPPDPTPAEHDSMLRYTVQEGDTVAGIARLFVVSEEEIRWANHIPEGGEFAPGVSIWIPVP